MQTVQTLSDIWETYFASKAQVVDPWAIVYMRPATQGLFVILANPFTEAVDEVLVERASQRDIALFTDHYKQRFIQQLPNRLGFFRPDVHTVLTEYPNWDEFAKTWMIGGADFMQSNMPLLFDYPSEREYEALKLKNQDYAGYRRLLVVIYQYRKQTFQRIFIEQVDDTAFARIATVVQQQFTDALPHLISQPEVIS